MNKKVYALVAINALAVACGASPGTQPHDMSQAGHEQAAAGEEQQAEQHAAQYDAGAEEPKKGCLAKGPCWTSLENPTEKHLEMAEAHRKTAAEHRAAATALAEAEAKACADLSETDRDMSPFAHREDVVSVAPLKDWVTTAKGKAEKTVGATVKFKAVKGLTAEYLQRIVSCHLARAAAVGHAMPEMPYCPLVPKGVLAKVTSAGDAFAVEIRSDDKAAAEEVLKRAQSLVAQ